MPRIFKHAVVATAAAGLASGLGTRTESITYITPIYEGLLASNDRASDISILQGMKQSLGIGGQFTKLGFSFSSWALSRDIHDANSDYAFDPSNLNYALGLAETLNLPILVHMNNGRWADCCTSNSDGGWNDALLDHIAAQPNTAMLSSGGKSFYGHDGGSNYFSLSRFNSVYRSYKQRNVKAASAILASWAAAHPDLFVGVSLDSETLYPSTDCDFNPLALQEWREFLQNTGSYGPGGQSFGQGRVPAFTSIDSFNQAMGTSFSSWSAVRPPSSIVAGQVFSEEWHRWRITMVDHALADETYWIASSGIDRNLIYGHQTPQQAYYQFADDPKTCTAANGAGGVTLYGWASNNLGATLAPLRGAGSNNWGTFELNPLTNDENESYNGLVALFDATIKVICPNAYEVVRNPDQYALFNSPAFGNTFGNALRRFLSDYANTPRHLSPSPWNPGNKVYDLYSQFDSSVHSGDDNHLNPTGSSGNVVRKTVYSAVGGSIAYNTTLPAVTGDQRLNFWTSVGISDGAGSGGSSSFQIIINGTPLLARDGLILPPNDWVWKRWTPIMIDVTKWAGKSVTIELKTGGNKYYGWTQWGAPAIYATNSVENNLALNRPVTVSSSDGISSGWGSSYLTDGHPQGGDFGSNGWSSGLHSSAVAEEWAQVDMGSITSVGKVILFPRSDLALAASTGFPTTFQIQASNDTNTWTTLVKLVDFPQPLAGHPQVFVFLPQSTRYIRIYATKLGGVAQESGYRIQLSQLAAYSG